MSDGAFCHYCQRSPCRCEEVVNVARWFVAADCGHKTKRVWKFRDKELCSECMLTLMNEGGPEERCGDST